MSNGDRARYGSITSKREHFVEWKRNAEREKGRLDAQALLDGMLEKVAFLDLVENFILFDDSRAGGTRKVVARNHQVLGVKGRCSRPLRLPRATWLPSGSIQPASLERRGSPGVTLIGSARTRMRDGSNVTMLPLSRAAVRGGRFDRIARTNASGLRLPWPRN